MSQEQIAQNYNQSKDGFSTESTIVSEETAGSDQWYCEATPSDLSADGTTKQSNIITVTEAVGDLEIISNFDSANIDPGYVIDGNQITFSVKPDSVISTETGQGYQYWFNFKVSNVSGKEITFHADTHGANPFLDETVKENQVVYSCDGENWNRITNHSYDANIYTFTETFSCNEVQVATFFPFSYTRMQALIDTAAASPWVVVTELGRSAGNRDIDLLTITNTASPDTEKEDIYIIGRQHAGETASSHMLKGLIEFLISDEPDAVAFRDHYVWYIVPMVNPDGVFMGKSRETSPPLPSIARDSNRDWGNSDSVCTNIVRDNINATDAAREIDFFIDWHSQMNDEGWENFVYSATGNTFFSILSDWTDFDSQSPSGASSCSTASCTARGYVMNNILYDLFYTFEPTPHLVSWTIESLNQQGVLVAYAIDDYFKESEERLFSDPEFDDSSTSEQLRENSLGQDWYESRGTIPEALLLVTDPVGDNVEGNKAALKTCGMTLGSDDYVYLTQEFSPPQTGKFAVSFDIYIDCIEDDGDRDRTGYVYIGDDSGGSSGPNSGSAERFVYLTFYDPDMSSGTDDLEIRAREYDNPGVSGPDQSWNTTSAWTPVASGLNYQTWYPVRVEVDVPGGTYDVYVNDVLVASDIKKFEKFASTSLTHLSFSSGYQGKGDFYVDNVRFNEIIDVPDLEVTPGYLGFGTDTETMTFQIKNVGDESFDWTASPDQPWITSIEPDTSPETLNPGESITCSVTIDRDLLGTAFPDTNCRMWGAISNTGLTSDVITHDLITGTTSLKKLTQFENQEGWGMARYTELGGIPVIQRGPVQAYYDPNFDSAVSAMAGATPKVAIAHVRNCTSGCCNPSEQIIDDPHPFYRQKNGKTWLFMHNGSISKTLLTNLIGAEYLAANPPNGSDIPACDPNIPDKVVDSELYFLLVLKNIEEKGWDVEKGIVETVFQMIGVSAANFIMTDGTTIWAYRNGHDLAFFYDAGTGVSAVASQPPEDTGWTIMKDKELVILKPGEAPKLFNVNDYPEGFVGWVTVETNHGEIAYVEAEADYAQEEIIVDNGEVPGTSYTGSWSPSSGTSPYGTTSGSLTTMTPGSTYTFEAPVDGFYNVSLWWTYYASRCTNVPVDIYDGLTLLDTVEVNQQENGGRWNQVGTYAFSSGTARIVVRAESSSCSTCADAVRFVSTLPPEFDRITVDGPKVVDENTSEQYVCIAHYVNGASRVVDPESCEVDCDNVSITPDGLLTASEVDSPEECQITMTYKEGGTTYSGNMDISIRDSLSLDDSGPGTEFTGDWSRSTGPDYFGVGSLYSMDPGATYSFEAPLTGSYDVQLWWTQTSGRCTGVPIRIYDGDTLLDTVEVNQRVDGGKFNSVGVYEFTGIARVTIVSENSGCSTNADAVRFVSAEPPEDIFACLSYGPGGAYDRSNFINIIEGFGAEQVGDIWVYRNETLGKTFRFHIVEDIDGMRQALYTKGATVLVRGHANYGSGPIFATLAEQQAQIIDDFYYIDDDRIFNISSEMVSLDIHGMRGSQAYPFYWPRYKDLTNGIMPFDFGDPLNPPPYNYYLTYQVPGDPTGTHYKVESAHNSAIERFPDSFSPAWYSAEGLSPNPDNPAQQKYFITNSTPWSPSFLTTGDWTETYSGTGYFKENYTYALHGTGESQAQWLFDIPEAGTYTVSAWWPASSSNSTAAPFTIHHGLGSNTVTRNQTLNGAQWVELGDFYFAPSLGWYESRGTIPDALSLVSYNVGGNSGNKAFLQTSGMSLGTDDYVYLSQAFTDAQAGTFSTSCDIYVDAIDDDADRDRTAYIYIGDDAEGSNGPNSTSSERFVLLAFYDPDLSNDISVNDLQLRARELDAPAQSWNTTSDWTLIKDGLSYHNWYNIEIEVNVAAGTYDVYVDGVLEGDDISKWEGYSSPTVTQISFSTGVAGQGNFYVDNVESPPGSSSLIVDSAFDNSADSEALREKNAPEYSVVLTNAVGSGRVVADAIRISHVDNPPEVIKAEFYAALPRSGEAPLQVNFENQSTGDISARHWDFGDGTSNDTRDSVEHPYTAPGTYTVSLTVSGPAGGDTETKVNYITVGGATPLQAEFSSPSNRERTAPFQVSFEDRSSGNIVSWLWDFGDGQTSTSRNPAHTYSSPGLYSVSLTVTDASHIVTETKQSFIRAKAKFDTTIDNVDYPITHFRNKVIINRGPLEIDKAQLQYSRLFYLACNTGNYFIDTFNRGVMFYDLNTTWVGVENGFSAYLNAYVQGKSDEEIWEQLQALDPVFDYYDFNKYPDEQGGG
ncbi:MAG: M14-type cytosolic carboxypeptidase [Desulfatiglandaceae bacterium]